MIRYLRHKDIDRKKWDACIEHALNRIIYAFSWYLDIVGPGWDALADDNYSAVFPLIHKRKSGIEYLYQPYFTQQLGLFSTKEFDGEIVNRYLNAIPSKFRFVEIHLNTMNKPGTDFNDFVNRVNLELDLIHPYDKLAGSYNENARRNLKKASNHRLTQKKNIETDELITLFRENFGKKEDKLGPAEYDMLKRLLEVCMQHTFSRIVGAYTPGGKLCAAAFFLEYKNRVIFHFAASDPLARENGAMYFLVDQFIREHSSLALTLDFEGSNDVNVARFYKGFGARESIYPMVRMDRLPALIRNGVYFVKKFRR